MVYSAHGQGTALVCNSKFWTSTSNMIATHYLHAYYMASCCVQVYWFCGVLTADISRRSMLLFPLGLGIGRETNTHTGIYLLHLLSHIVYTYLYITNVFTYFREGYEYLLAMYYMRTMNTSPKNVVETTNAATDLRPPASSTHKHTHTRTYPECINIRTQQHFVHFA